MPRDAFGNIIPGSYGPTGNAALRPMQGAGMQGNAAMMTPNRRAMMMGPQTNASPAAAALLRSPVAAARLITPPQLGRAPVARPIGTPVRAPEMGAAPPTNFSSNAAAILRQQQINAYRPR